MGWKGWRPKFYPAIPLWRMNWNFDDRYAAFMLLALQEYEGLSGEAWQDTIDAVRRILRNLPDNGPHVFHRLWKRIALPKGHARQKEMPWTDCACWS